MTMTSSSHPDDCVLAYLFSPLSLFQYPDVLLDDIAGPDGDPLLMSLKLAMDVLASNIMFNCVSSPAYCPLGEKPSKYCLLRVNGPLQRSSIELRYHSLILFSGFIYPQIFLDSVKSPKNGWVYGIEVTSPAK